MPRSGRIHFRVAKNDTTLCGVSMTRGAVHWTWDLAQTTCIACQETYKTVMLASRTKAAEEPSTPPKTDTLGQSISLNVNLNAPSVTNARSLQRLMNGQGGRNHA